MLSVIVKASSGPRYVVGCRNKVDKEKLAAGTRVALDMTTLTIMRALPREVTFPRFHVLRPCKPVCCILQRVQCLMEFDEILLLLICQVDPVVYNMLHEDPGNVSYSAVGGLNDQIRELRESIELPLMNPELFLRVGIKPPKVRCCCERNVALVLLQTSIMLNQVPLLVSGSIAVRTPGDREDIVSQSYC